MAGDSYRPTRGRPPPLVNRVTFTNGGGDSYDTYRPGPSQGGNSRNNGEFTFQSGRQGPQFPPVQTENEKASNPRRRNRGGRGGAGSYSNNQREAGAPQHSAATGRRGQNGHRRGGFRPFRKEAPHERALLQSRTGGSPERTLGVINGVNRFLDLDDLSASEEEMDIDGDKAAGDDSTSDGAEPSHKVARVQVNDRADGDSVPKWSNPDPYTVLPPPNETTGTKRDIVQLIRKAKNQSAEKAAASNAVAANDDFISFGDDNVPSKMQATVPPPPPARPRRPSSPPPPPPPPLPVSRPLVGSLNDVAATGTLSMAPQTAKRSTEAAGLPERPQRAGRLDQKRKRNQFDGGIVGDWLANSFSSPVPWCQNSEYVGRLASNPGTDYKKMTMLLHNEILDFYDFVMPDEHDKRVRNNLIKRIERTIGTRGLVLPDVSKVHCFGSFPAAMYLPTADMDIVLCTKKHSEGGPPMLDFGHHGRVSKALWAATRKLQQAGIAIDTQVVTRAKVPITKFVDKQSGIKVDLSLENLTGVAAQETFRQWKEDLLDLVIVVALVKQFLVMRGLNDVHMGGIGGFTIICLVYHYMKLETAKEGESPNLGDMFLGFFDYYGNKFDLATQRLVMEPGPPRVVAKQEFGIDGRREKVDGLSIQDPNNPENNISGGSAKAKLIFKVFADAHKVLQERLATLDLSGISILETVLGGNYESYRLHREQMRRTA